MKIALIGATGSIGQCILREALHRGHSVTAIVRDPSKITESNPCLTVVRGDALDAQSIADNVAGHDAVVSAFSPRGGSNDAYLVVARALLDGLDKAHVKRLFLVGGAGSTEVSPGLQFVDSPQFPETYKPRAFAQRAELEFIRANAGGLEWTYFSPAAVILPGDRTGKFRLGGEQLVTDAAGKSQISTEDFAIAVIDELENPRHIGQRFTIGY